MTSSPELFPERFISGAKAAANALKQVNNVIVAAHVNPDGDALGALAAAGWMLRHMGKDFALYVPGDVPRYLKFLPLPGTVYASLSQLPFAPQTGIYVDCSDTARLGPELAPRAMDWDTINIDHHICQQGLGSLANFIDTAAAATCQLMAYVALTLNIPLTGELAEAIGLGLITDTGQFTHGNTTPSVFVLAAALEVGGLNIPELGEKLHSGLALKKLQLWGRLFQRIKLSPDGKAAYCPLLLSDLEETGCQAEDMEGFVDWLRNINGVQIGVFARQIEDHKSKFSLRSKGHTDVQIIAAAAGGGGHKNAAGGIIDAMPAEAIDHLLKIAAKYLPDDTRQVPERAD